jgi:phage-related protein
VSLVKTVELRVLTDAGDAQAKLDEIDAKAKDLEASDIKMRFRVDDADGKAQLDDLRVKADKLGFKDVSIKVRVDGAGRAIAELAAVRREEEKASSGGLMSRIGSFFGAGGPMGGGGALPLPVAALPAILPAIGAGLVEVTGLVSGFAAATAGAVAFGVLAAPAVKKVSAAYSGLNTAQQAYQLAQAKYAVSPTKANATSEQTALVNLEAQKKLLSEMSPSEQGAVRGIQGLVTEFGKASRAFEPAAFKVFNDGLKIANHLLPAVTPFANTFANSLDGLLKKADKFTQSKGFGDFLKQFRSIEGPAVTAIGTGIGNVANSIGKLLTTMNGKDVAQTIGIAFNTISGTISGVTFVVRRLMQNWDQMLGGGKAAIHGVASAFDHVRRAGATAGHDVAHAFDASRGGVADFGHNVASQFDHVRGNIHRWGADTGSFIASNWKTIAAVTTGGVGLIVDAVATHLPGVKKGFDIAFKEAASIVKGGVRWVSEAAAPLGHALSAGWSGLSSVVSGVWAHVTSSTGSGVSAVKGILAWFGSLPGLFRGWWDGAASGVSSGIGKIVGFAESLPGRINSALGGLPGMMLRAGVNVINSLISGIESRIGKLGSVVAGIARKVAGFFGLSPAVEGPLSGGGAPEIRGQHFAGDITRGMLSGVPGVASAASRLAGAAAIGPAGARGGPGGGQGGDHNEFHFHGVTTDQGTVRQLVQAVREYKRHGGGAALGIA